MHINIKHHITTKENLFYSCIDDNYNWENDTSDIIDHEIYEMYDYYLYLLKIFCSLHKY